MSIFDGSSKIFPNSYKKYPWKEHFLLDWCLTDVFHRNFGNLRDIISRRAPSESLWIKDYRIIFFLYVEDNATIFFWQGIVLPGLFS